MITQTLRIGQNMGTTRLQHHAPWAAPWTSTKLATLIS